MKAFTVYQPFAHAIVEGLKKYETRSRRTHIRGRVAVHAAAKEFPLLDEVAAYYFAGWDSLPHGVVMGTVEIVDCVPVEEVIPALSSLDRLLGDFSPGSWAWVLKNPVMFETPIPARGKQGWWNWEGEG